MERRRFRRLVVRAIESLPEEYQIRLENVEVLIEERPSHEHLDTAGLSPGDSLLGLYEGVPLTERTGDYGLVTPDIITIFQRPIEAICSSDDEVVEQVRQTVQHEIAHFFGISDERLDELGRS